MNGDLFLFDFSHIKRSILAAVVNRQCNLATKERIFNTLAKTNNFTAKNLQDLSKLTNLSYEELLAYDRGTTKNHWRGTYKGILYEFDPNNFEITFRKLDWQVIDTAKVSELITAKELDRLAKDKIDKRIIF